MATVADIVGETLPEDAGEDSASFLPALMGEAEPVRDDLIHHSCMGVFSIRRGDWKLIVDCDNSGDMGRGIDGCAGTGPVPGLQGVSCIIWEMIRLSRIISLTRNRVLYASSGRWSSGISPMEGVCDGVFDG